MARNAVPGRRPRSTTSFRDRHFRRSNEHQRRPRFSDEAGSLLVYRAVENPEEIAGALDQVQDGTLRVLGERGFDLSCVSKVGAEALSVVVVPRITADRIHESWEATDIGDMHTRIRRALGLRRPEAYEPAIGVTPAYHSIVKRGTTADVSLTIRDGRLEADRVAIASALGAPITTIGNPRLPILENIPDALTGDVSDIAGSIGNVLAGLTLDLGPLILDREQ